VKPIAWTDLYYLSVVGAIGVLDHVPSASFRQLLSGTLGSVAYRLSRKKRELIEESVERAFGIGLQEARRKAIVKGAFEEFWVEVLGWTRASAEWAKRNVVLRGGEHLHQALQRGRGAILWESRGLGRRLHAKAVLRCHGFPIHQVHGPNDLGGFLTHDSAGTWTRRFVVRTFFEKRERLLVSESIRLPSTDSLAFTRVLLSRLQQNGILCASGDGRYGHKLIPLEFLGRSCLFAPGMASLAKLSGAPILPLFCLRERNGAYRLRIEPPLEVRAGLGREREIEDLLRCYAALLEERIRLHPEQYRNWHLLDAGSDLIPRG
jgi:lauroyl/myristoyl acyltransferase